MCGDHLAGLWSSAFEKLATMVAGGDTPDVVGNAGSLALPVCQQRQAEASLEPYLAQWSELSRAQRAERLGMARAVNKTAYLLPYGLYLRALV